MLQLFCKHVVSLVLLGMHVLDIGISVAHYMSHCNAGHGHCLHKNSCTADVRLDVVNCDQVDAMNQNVSKNV